VEAAWPRLLYNWGGNFIGFRGKMVDSIGNVLFIDWAAYVEGNEGEPFPFQRRRFFGIYKDTLFRLSEVMLSRLGRELSSR
jgi:hypothetical protein